MAIFDRKTGEPRKIKLKNKLGIKTEKKDTNVVDAALDSVTRDNSKAKLFRGLNESMPVDGVILPDGKAAIVKNESTIVPIDRNLPGTLNQDGFFNLNITSNPSNAVIYVNGENTFKTTPNKLSFSLTDVITTGGKTISVGREGYESFEQYTINVIQNPDFQESAFDTVTNTLVNNDGLYNIRPEKPIYTKTAPYTFKIDYFERGVLQSSDAVLTENEVKEFLFKLTTKNITSTDIITSEVNEAKVYNVTINVKGPANSVNVTNLKTQENTKLNTGVTTLIVEVGTTLQFTSTNKGAYSLKNAIVTTENFKPKELLANDTDSLSFEYAVEGNTVVDVISEEANFIIQAKPVVTIVSPQEVKKYNINSKEDYIFAVQTQNATSIDVYIKDKKLNFEIPNTNNVNGLLTRTVVNQNEIPPTIISIPKTVFNEIGNYKIFLIAKNADLEEQPVELGLSVVDEVYVGTPDISRIVYPKELKGADFVGTDVDFKLSYESLNTDFVRIHVNGSSNYFQEGPNANLTLNVKKLVEFSSYSGNSEKIVLNLSLIPYNTSGYETIKGKEELITITFIAGNLKIPKEQAINRIADIFISQIEDYAFGNERSKYLNHLLHIPGKDNQVIATWTGSFDSLILKLYEPLPVNVALNEQVWISKPQSNTIIETVNLVTETTTVCNTLKGPNFSLQPDNGIEYSIFEDLVASGSFTSTDIVNEYAIKSGIDTQKLNIEFISGSTYLWENFVHFSSAEERVKNFFYKVQLIEYYKNLYETLLPPTYAAGVVLTENGFEIVTEDGIFSLQHEVQLFTGPSQMNQAKKAFDSLNELLRGMDAFEKWLYKSTDASAYPKTLVYTPSLVPYYQIVPTDTTSAISWYDNILQLAEEYDESNPNYLVNNLPRYMVEEGIHDDFLLFFDMIGQHFDVVWLYIKSLANAKAIEASKFKGITNELVQHMLKSLGWENKKAYNSQFLWEYAFGLNKDGTQKYSTSLKEANEEVWRRILNNLPYILKHKGTGRALKAIMSCYGIPQSLLTIMEFGGPQDPTKGGSTKFTFDDRTAAIYLSGSSLVKVPWQYFTGSLNYPNAIEFRIKPSKLPNTKYSLISGSEWSLDLVQTTGSFGKLELNFGGDQSVSTYFDEPFVSASVSTYYIVDASYEPYAFGPDYKTGSLDFPISTEFYSNVIINRHDNADSSSWFEVWLGTSDGQRIITSVSMSLLSYDAQWTSGSTLQIGGNGYEGNVDEFRLWTEPLSRSKFDNHTLFPDAINGNQYNSSTEHLLFRLDFEYPKNRILDPYIKNVAINRTYDGELSFATASNMYSASSYPYQYTPYDRTVTANVPSIGFGYSNKIRFESASLVTDLSYKQRATKKAFDQAPIDSNRLGLFFSPIKELNMDILKTFGDFNIDNYIGDPRDEYKDTYSELETLREYYFQRMNQNINEYIQLVRYIDKSLFDVLDDLAPARAKISKGLLIEPHFLERSKTKWKKAESERNDYDSFINTIDDVILESESIPKDALLDAQTVATLIGERNDFTASVSNTELTIITETPFYTTSIDYSTDETFTVDVPTYTASIQCPTGSSLTGEVDAFIFEAIGMERDSLANAGFGLYARNGNAIVSSFDGVFGNYYITHVTASITGGDRKSVFLIKEQFTKKVSVQTEGWPATNISGQAVKYEDVLITNYKYKVSTLPFSGSIGVGGNINEVKAINGYLPTHYRYVNGLGEGMVRSFWKGSQQTATTTPDGLSPVETFTTNPNILRVAKTGRGSGEPILEAD
jgi:hypothetical protein